MFPVVTGEPALVGGSTDDSEVRTVDGESAAASSSSD
jgi:hypothetical protein